MKIKQTDQLFLEALKASLQQKSVDWESEEEKQKMATALENGVGFI